MFARFSYKNRQVITAPSAACTFTYCAEAGSPLQGAYNTPEIDEGLTFAHNYVFTPHLLNEFRGGFNAQHTSETQSYSTNTTAQSDRLTVPQPDTAMVGGAAGADQRVHVHRRGQSRNAARTDYPGARQRDLDACKHSFKFGADFKRITDHDDNVFGNYRSGWYVFNGSSIVQPWAAPSAIRTTAFLLGYPDYTEVSSTNDPTMDGRATPMRSLGRTTGRSRPPHAEPGLRYELHPPIKEITTNTATSCRITPRISAPRSTVNGAVIVSNAQALSQVVSWTLLAPLLPRRS
jgi:hypothetical protein